ncbi:hypothetical protein GCM10011369_08740 [Neiella marina]|uniref:Uncharacterized protein n=1 Tax=Neiella marina TaxID=508461 RepID=A0A8J2XN64_9GAMM|nr:hypothetical protein [Neiella marina]GGA69337.1 hypothetical protein GCM10011369_08740 [Neiella marina]
MVWDGVDRRKGPDWRVRTLRGLAILAWLLFIISLLLFHFARPEMDSGIARYYELEIRQFWDPSYTGPLMYFVWSSCVISLLSLIANRQLSRRAGDTRRYNLILLTVITVSFGILLTVKLLAHN